jgi:hypothetical protein
MFERLPVEIVHIILTFLIGERYLALRYVNKLMNTCINATARDYIRNYFAISGRRFDYAGLLSLMRRGITRRLMGLFYMKIQWKHMYEPISVSMTSMLPDRGWINNISALYITIGGHVLTFLANCTRSDDVSTVRWRNIAECRQDLQRLNVLKEYLPELYVFTETPIIIHL